MANKKPKTSQLEPFYFKKGTSGNPGGRPKKFFSKVLEEIKKHGEVVGPNAIKEVYQVMISLDEHQIKQIVNDKDLPMLYRIIGKKMMAKDGFEAIERMLDRANGKPKITQEIKGADLDVNIVLPKPDEDILRQWERAKNNSIEDNE